MNTSLHPSSTPAQGRIIVGVDGSEPSTHALRWARFLSEATGSGITVVSAWQAIRMYSGLGAGWAAMPTDWYPAADAEKAAVAVIDEVFGEHRPPDIELTVSEGNPAHVLLQASEGARMLLVGSRGHGGFAGLLLGSVSAACAEHATCPVLVLHGQTPPPTRTDIAS